MLNDLNNVLVQYYELQQYSNLLPENLMIDAKNTIEQNIPSAGNEILSLLNSVSGKTSFKSQNTVSDLINLLKDKAKEIDDAFELVPENKKTIGFERGEVYTAKDILNYQNFWFKAHCDNINSILIAGKFTSEHLKNRNSVIFSCSGCSYGIEETFNERIEYYE